MDSKSAKIGKWSSEHQRNHCLEQHLRKGAKMTPNGAPERIKLIFALETVLLRSKSLFYEKCKNERKCAKRVKMNFRIPKNSLSTEGLAPWARNERLQSPTKTTFCKRIALLHPKRVVGAVCRFGRKKSEDSILGNFGSKNVPRCLCFPPFGARGGKDDFKESCCSDEEKINKSFLAQHKT